MFKPAPGRLTSGPSRRYKVGMGTRRLKDWLRRITRFVEGMPTSDERRRLDQMLQRAWTALIEEDPPDDVGTMAPAVMTDDGLLDEYERLRTEDRRMTQQMYDLTNEIDRRKLFTRRPKGGVKHVSIPADELLSEEYDRLKLEQTGTDDRLLKIVG